MQFAAAEAHLAAGALSQGGPRPQQPNASALAAPHGTGSAPGAPQAHGDWAQGRTPGAEPYFTGPDTRRAAWRSPQSSGAPTGGTIGSERSSGWGHAAWRSPPGSGALVGGTIASQGGVGWGNAAWASPPRSGAPTGGTVASEGSSAGDTPPVPGLTPSGVTFPALGALSALCAAGACTPDSAHHSAQWRANAWPAPGAADPSNNAPADAADSGSRRRWDQAGSPDPTLSPGLGAVARGSAWRWAEARSPNPDLSPGLGGTPDGAGAHAAYMRAWDGDGGGAPCPSALAALAPLAQAALSPRSAVKQQVCLTCGL